ncbi:MAG: alpha/beta hydrolase [Phycisphaerales bacterium]
MLRTPLLSVFVALSSLAVRVAAQPQSPQPGEVSKAAATPIDPAEAPTEPLGPSLEGYDYPFPVKTHTVAVQGQALSMAYMDVPPAEGKGSGRIVVLLHGKNFFGAYWERTAKDLSAAGYRVVIPDQIGFGKSSKPEDVQYTLHMLAQNTASLLDSLHATKVDVVGHSTGGMIAARFALMFPDRVSSLTLVNPIGLEDYRLKVPYLDVAGWYEREVKQTYASLAKYQRDTYYAGSWSAEYAKWVKPIAAMTLGPGWPRVARVSALTYDMIYTQPVCYELGQIKAPTLLIIGQRDRSAIGKDRAAPEVAKTMGDFAALGKWAAKTIPSARLVELDNVGHMPMTEAYDRFIGPLKEFLGAQPAVPAPATLVEPPDGAVK